MSRHKNKQHESRHRLIPGKQKLLLACCIMALGNSAWSKDQKWECVVAADGMHWDCGKRQAAPRPPLPEVVSPPAPDSSTAIAAPPQTPSPALEVEKPADSRTSAQEGKSESTGDQVEKVIPAPEVDSPPAPDSGTAIAVPSQTPSPVMEEEKPADDGTSVQEGKSESTGGQVEKVIAAEAPGQIPDAESTYPASEFGSQMPDLDEGLDSMSCRPEFITSEDQSSDDNQLLQIEADGGWAFPEEESAHFSGNVVLISPENEIYADDLSYSRKTGEITTQGELQIRTKFLRLQGERAQYDLNTQQGRLHDVEYRIPSQHARGHADLAEISGRQSGRYENITYSTCPVGNDDFILSAKSLTIDLENDEATFEGAKLGFLGVPVFYIPKMTVTLNDERKSGLLIPTLGYSSKNGLDLALPYYLNLAPNYDATLIPRIISKRGPALGAEFRFLADRHKGDMLGELLYDRKYKDGEVRGAFHLNTQSNLAPNLSGNVLVNYVSDDDYLEDLGNSLAVSSTQHLLSRARLTYHADYWDLYGDVTSYKTLDDAILVDNKPYSQLPRIRFDLLKHDGPGSLDYSMLAEYIYFFKDSGTTGHRLDLNPGISFPWRTDWAYVEPGISARYTGYQLQDQPDEESASQDRSLFSASIDSGMFFDRSANWFGHGITHTLEPRAYYLYTPYKDQSDLPLFDTGRLDFSFDNLFRGNRFNGPDRVGDANQIALALSSSVLHDATGEELLRASIGQIYYFEDRSVTLYDTEPVDTSSSSVIAQISGKMNTQWQYRAGVQVNPHTDRDSVRQGLAQVVYRGEQNQMFNAAYRLREDVVEQTDVGFIWPVTSNVNMIGRWYYSLQDSQTMEAVAGVEYGRCCWRIRAILRRYLDDKGREHTNTAMIQIELNGLGKLGHDIDNYLDKSIYGY